MQKLFSFFNSFYIPKVHIADVFEMLLLLIVVYQLRKRLKNTRAWVIIRGIIVLLFVYSITIVGHLVVIESILKQVLSLSLVAMIFLLEPEIKKCLETIGSLDFRRLFKFRITKDYNFRYSSDTIDAIVDACSIMSKAKTGALIIFEMDSILNEYISTGISIDSAISSQMLVQIFEKNTPLHDGALIIRNDRLASATCYLPLSNNHKISKGLGTRHRAGIGLSELTDAIVIIVSEETGAISVVKSGKIEHGISINRLRKILESNREIVVENNHSFIQRLNVSVRGIVNLCFCTIVSIMVWVSIINIENPIATKPYTVPITIINEQSLSDVGKTYKVVGNNYVEIKVTATRKALDKLTSDKVIANVDLSKLSYTNAVPVEACLAEGINSNTYSLDTDNAMVQLKLDEIVELNLDASIEPIGVCADGYYISKLSTNKPEVNIVGAQSIVKTIDKAVLHPLVNGLSKNTPVECDILVYDKNGNPVNLDSIKLSKNKYIVNVDVVPTKEIPININTKNNKTSDYELLGLESDINKLTVAGTSEVLNGINSVDINIDLSKESISESYIKSINIAELLPEGVLLTGDSTQINITMTFDIYPTKSIKIDSSDIKLRNLSSGLKCKFTNKSYTLVFKGDNVDKVSKDKLGFSLDLDNLNSGEYSLPIKVSSIPNDVMLVSDGVINFVLKP